MDYIEKVLLATGGTAAPEEILDEDEIIQPEPEDTEEVTEAALEKEEDDPCWSGYVQVGMKEKDGKRVPNCVPTSAAIDFVVESYNSEVGASRHVTAEASYEVAKKAYEKYSYLADNDAEMYSAILWDLHVFSEYATTGTAEVDEDLSTFQAYLPEGHPDTEASLIAAATWVAGAPELSNSSRDVILNAFSEDEDYVKSLHASTRLRAMVSSGSLTATTLNLIKTLSDRHSKVN
jgi:hypothetical protein